MKEDKINLELKGLIENIHRYCASNKNNVSFVYSFVGFKKDPTHKCDECGDDCDEVNEKASTMGAYGDIFTLRELLNGMRDMVEDEVDENGFVNL